MTCSFKCLKLHLWMMILQTWRKNCLEAQRFVKCRLSYLFLGVYYLITRQNIVSTSYPIANYRLKRQMGSASWDGSYELLRYWNQQFKLLNFHVYLTLLFHVWLYPTLLLKFYFTLELRICKTYISKLSSVYMIWSRKESFLQGEAPLQQARDTLSKTRRSRMS